MRDALNRTGRPMAPGSVRPALLETRAQEWLRMFISGLRMFMYNVEKRRKSANTVLFQRRDRKPRSTSKQIVRGRFCEPPRDSASRHPKTKKASKETKPSPASRSACGQSGSQESANQEPLSQNVWEIPPLEVKNIWEMFTPRDSSRGGPRC